MKITLSRDTLPSGEIKSGPHGAAVVFRGVVRELEDGMPISGIDYSCYPALAERQLREIVDECHRRFGEHGGSISHRIGFVAVGETAIVIEITTERSSEAFDICRWYLSRIKKDVPVWKEPVFAGAQVTT